MSVEFRNSGHICCGPRTMAFYLKQHKSNGSREHEFIARTGKGIAREPQDDAAAVVQTPDGNRKMPVAIRNIMELIRDTWQNLDLKIA